MYSQEQVQHALFRQSALNTDPGSPAGILIPRDASSKITKDKRNKIDNKQVFADGFERPFALGNFMTEYQLKSVCNLDWVGDLLIAICGTNPAPIGKGIASIPVSAGGTGYATAPTVVIPAPNAGGVQAVATATVVSGAVTAITITNPGENYFGTVTVTLTGGGGTGATLGTTVLGGPYRRVYVPSPNVILHLLEEGIPIGSEYHKIYDLVADKFTMDCPVEGELEIDTHFTGSGNQTTVPGSAPLDAAAHERVGALAEYAFLTILDDGADTGDISHLQFDLTRTVIAKRPHGRGGKASKLIYGSSKVAGKLTSYYDTDARAAKVRAGTLFALKSTIVAGTSSLETFLPEVKAVPTGKSETKDGVMLEHEISPVRSADVTNTPVRWTLVNNVAQYT